MMVQRRFAVKYKICRQVQTDCSKLFALKLIPFHWKWNWKTFPFWRCIFLLSEDVKVKFSTVENRSLLSNPFHWKWDWKTLPFGTWIAFLSEDSKVKFSTMENSSRLLNPFDWKCGWNTFQFGRQSKIEVVYEIPSMENGIGIPFHLEDEMPFCRKM